MAYWIRKTDEILFTHYVCSACGYIEEIKGKKYCAECGEDMSGKEETMKAYEFIKTMNIDEMTTMIFSWIEPYIMNESDEIKEMTRKSVRAFLETDLKVKK